MGMEAEGAATEATLASQTAYRDVVPVTPDDAATFEEALSGVEVGAAGDLTVVTGAGAERTISAAPGRIYPIRVTKVKATGTTATEIVGYVA
jgi:hypothetical protein